MKDLKNQFVLGFAFSKDGSELLLIQKNRPDWQRGKLNGIGGKIKEEELHVDAMVREFQEETTISTQAQDWQYYCCMVGDWGNVHVFKCFCDISGFASATDEKVVKVRVENNVPDFQRHQAIPNLKWLIPMAFDGQAFAVVDY